MVKITVTDNGIAFQGYKLVRNYGKTRMILCNTKQEGKVTNMDQVAWNNFLMYCISGNREPVSTFHRMYGDF